MKNGCAVLALVICTASAPAADYSLTNPAGGNRNAPATWGGTVPGHSRTPTP